MKKLKGGVPHNSESDAVVYFDVIKLYETAVLCSSHPYMIDLSLIPWTQCDMVCWSEEVVASRRGYGESMLYKPCAGPPGQVMLDQGRIKAGSRPSFRYVSLILDVSSLSKVLLKHLYLVSLSLRIDNIVQVINWLNPDLEQWKLWKYFVYWWVMQAGHVMRFLYHWFETKISARSDSYVSKNVIFDKYMSVCNLDLKIKWLHIMIDD